LRNRSSSGEIEFEPGFAAGTAGKPLG